MIADLLTEWLPQQRWFGAKGREIGAVQIVADRTLVEGASTLRHLLVGVDLGEDVETYQLLVGESDEVPARLEHAVIGRVDDCVLYDAAHDSELTHVLLQLLASGADEAGLRFRRLPGADVNTDLTSIVMSAEQSNTSIVFGEDYILKLFRKVAPGVNPDLEVTRALAEAGCAAIVPPLAWVEDTGADGTATDETSATTLGLLQPFLRSASEGWQLAVTSVRDLYAEGDLHADEVGGDFAGEAERLGTATAEVHELMRQVLPSRIADQAESQETAKTLHGRLDAALEVVPELATYSDDLRTAYDALGAVDRGVPVQRIHGDFHLGQVLRTDAGWVLIDFEGEPARPLRERIALASPLRDVAGMLRSFDYAARHLLAEHTAAAGLEYRAGEWAERNRDAFCTGYGRAAGRDPREDDVLLRAFELDKAVYEVVYEARHRPTWLPIPLGSIERLVR
ncbi:MAG TPA: phosphotransferase [Mycobacteriales bacterium]|nr:phosphotransferase [Mycobacteriales bacterium]